MNCIKGLTFALILWFVGLLPNLLQPPHTTSAQTAMMPMRALPGTQPNKPSRPG